MSQDEDEMLFDDFLCDSQEICESQHFTVLSADDVISLMKNETEKVREIVNVSAIFLLAGDLQKLISFLQLNPAQLRMLLTKHKWDIDSFLEKFYDGKVELPAKRPSSSKGSIKREENKENKGRLSKKRKMPASSKSEAPISRRTRNNKGSAEKECDICAQSCAIEVRRIEARIVIFFKIPFLAHPRAGLQPLLLPRLSQVVHRNCRQSRQPYRLHQMSWLRLQHAH